MRVAIVQSETRFVGGIERVTEGILRQGIASDIEWHAVFLRPGLLAERTREWFPAERSAVIDAGRLRNVPRTVVTIAKIARQLRRWKTDVVLSQGFHSQCYGGPAARIAGTRNVFWCHNLLPSGGVIDDPIVRLALRMAADTVIGAPESNLVNLQRYYATRCPVRLVYPAHPMEEFKRGDGARIRRELGIDHHTPLAMIVSRLQRGKGQDVFIRAAARVAHQLPTVRFVIVGGTAMPGDSAYEAELKRMAGEAGLANRVIFTGERHDVPDLLAAADVFVMASTAPEMFGLALGEAMAAGKAVIATKAGGPAEIVENGQSGLLTAPGNDEELAAALLRVFSDDSLREQLQRNAVVRFESRFSFERMSAELSCVLRDAAASRARAGANRLPAPTAGRAE